MKPYQAKAGAVILAFATISVVVGLTFPAAAKAWLCVVITVAFMSATVALFKAYENK